MNEDDRVRDLVRWVKNEESNGVECSAIFDAIGDRAIRRYGLKPDRKFLVDKGVREVTFADTDLVIRHDGTEWQLVGPDDPKA